MAKVDFLSEKLKYTNYPMHIWSKIYLVAFVVTRSEIWVALCNLVTIRSHHFLHSFTISVATAFLSKKGARKRRLQRPKV